MPLVLFVVFIVVPIIELAVIIQVGQAIGTLPTVVLLVAVSLVGAALVRREGLRAWTAFRNALRAGRAPTAEVVDGALVLFSGALLLTPGFVTDALGLSLVFPPTRRLYSRIVRSRIRTRLLGPPPSGRARRGAPGAPTFTPPQHRTDKDAPGRQTIDVEVVDIQRDGSGESS